MSASAGFNRTIPKINYFHLLFSDVLKEVEHLVDKIQELNLEDNLQTTETVGGFSQDLQPTGN